MVASELLITPARAALKARGSRRRVTLGFAIFLALASPLQTRSAAGADTAPFATRNMNPFTVMYGRPTPQPARAIARGQLRTGMRFTLANNSTSAATADETIVLDGESYALDLTLAYGYTQRWELGISLPLIYHNEGYLDHFIQNWHDVLGLSNGRRDEFAPNELEYAYFAHNLDAYAIDDSRGGLGDVVFIAKYAMLDPEVTDPHIAIGLELKAPTGNPDQLTGSGAMDVALSVHASDERLLASIHTTLYGGAGIAFLGAGEVLADAQKDSAAAAYLGGVWYPWPNLALKLQLDYQSALYSSNLKQLGTDALALYVGGSYASSKSTRFDVAIGENLYTDPTPDFLVYFGVTTTRQNGK